MLTSFNFFFFVFKTHNVDLIQIVLIKIRFNILVCSLLSTYFFIFLQEYLINCTVTDSIILLLPVKFISVCGIMPAVFSRPTLIHRNDKNSTSP